MTQKEWLEYFETVNGRKPSAQEFGTSKAAGEFSVSPVTNATTDSAGDNKPQKKKKKWLLPTIIAAAIIAILVSGFTYWQISSNSMNGTYFTPVYATTPTDEKNATATEITISENTIVINQVGIKNGKVETGSTSKGTFSLNNEEKTFTYKDNRGITANGHYSRNGNVMIFSYDGSGNENYNFYIEKVETTIVYNGSVIYPESQNSKSLQTSKDLIYKYADHLKN